MPESSTPRPIGAMDLSVSQQTYCLKVCFTQRVNQPMPRSQAVRGVRERPLATAVFRPFWHGHGTDASARRSDRRPPSRYVCSGHEPPAIVIDRECPLIIAASGPCVARLVDSE
jgi:hypothetical protein